MNEQPLRPLKRRGAFSPVLIELTVVILFFALSTSIVVQLIAAARPSTFAELQEIKGIGPVKVQRFGRALLDLVAGAPQYSD